jgi:hypothetical protein
MNWLKFVPTAIMQDKTMKNCTFWATDMTQAPLSIATEVQSIPYIRIYHQLYSFELYQTTVFFLKDRYCASLQQTLASAKYYFHNQESYLIWNSTDIAHYLKLQAKPLQT